MTGRRQFLRHASARLAAASLMGISPPIDEGPYADGWDLRWPQRLSGKRRAVFDVAELDSGFGLFRAASWASQCVRILGDSSTDVSVVIVLRVRALVLALEQSFWDRLAVGHIMQASHPVTGEDTMRNPALMNESDGLPGGLANGTLPRLLAGGATVLACNMAVHPWVDAIRRHEGLSDDAARAAVIAALLPGVILQPSGVLAVLLAEEHGCRYIRAS